VSWKFPLYIKLSRSNGYSREMKWYHQLISSRSKKEEGKERQKGKQTVMFVLSCTHRSVWKDVLVLVLVLCFIYTRPVRTGFSEPNVVLYPLAFPFVLPFVTECPLVVVVVAVFPFDRPAAVAGMVVLARSLDVRPVVVLAPVEVSLNAWSTCVPKPVTPPVVSVVVVPSAPVPVVPRALLVPNAPVVPLWVVD